MLSKATIKYVKSLQVKKYRKQEQCFMVEGAKSVLELLKSDFTILKLLATNDFLLNVNVPPGIEVIAVKESELGALGEYQTNNAAIAIARMKPNRAISDDAFDFALVLDDIRDPGNLGTIIRTADWFNIRHIIASEETADFYNPKVISATMGSFTRVSVYYTDLVQYLSTTGQKVYGAYLDGEDVHEISFFAKGLILMGNESRGISRELEKFVTDKITIPRYGQAESLNAAIATAVICDNLRRSLR